MESRDLMKKGALSARRTLHISRRSLVTQSPRSFEALMPADFAFVQSWGLPSVLIGRQACGNTWLTACQKSRDAWSIDAPSGSLTAPVLRSIKMEPTYRAVG